jgi:hypothetical protein
MRRLDNLLALAICAVYLAGSAVLVLRALLARGSARRRAFSCGELALLPRRWRRWVLDERDPPARP